MSDDQERTAAMSDARHEGFGAGIASVEDEWAARVAAAEQRGYDRAAANLRSADEESNYWGDLDEAADYLESQATKEPDHA